MQQLALVRVLVQQLLLPQAAKAAAAMMAAKTRDLVMIIILKVSKKQFPGNCHQVRKILLTEQQALELLLFSL